MKLCAQTGPGPDEMFSMVQFKIDTVVLALIMRTAIALCIGLFALAARPAAALDITLDPWQPGRTFEGIGAVSAGASSRLLIDYPEPQRSQILDYLFKPDYGAALQHLKVEIGGEVNSTDGTEPTHMRTRTDLNFNRGFEWWLMQQAVARNPKITLDCLAWGAPGWIGSSNYYSQDMCNYIVSFLEGAQTNYGLTFSFTGTHNESAINTTWIKLLRSTLNANGLQSVQLVAADEWGGTWNIVTNTSYGLLYDPALSNAVARVGAHYPGSTCPPGAQACGKALWASEDGIGGSTWSAAMKLAKIFNRNYITGRMTTTEIWSPVTAYYDILAAADSGLMRANTPWSGNYQVAPAIWAAAHTTQFASPGWSYLEGGASALLPAGGSVVTLMSTNQSDYSIVVETSDATNAQTVTFHLTNGLPAVALNLWQTTQSSQFVNQGQVIPSGGMFTCTFQPAAIYTLTTTSGQAKGGAAPPPAAPFPLPFKDDFESYAAGATPKYFCTQAGAFEIWTRTDGRGQSLRQVSPQTGIRWTSEWQPYALIGDASWTDYDVAADVLIETNGGVVFIQGRVGSVPGFTDPLPRGYWLGLNNATAQWQLYASSNLLAAGAASASTNVWHNLRLAMQGTALRCYVDHALVTNITDLTYPSGMAGLGCGGWYGAQFDNFTLRQLHGTDFDLGLAATASASSIWQNDPTYAASMANDGNPATRWNTAYPTLSNEWLELDWPAPVSFNRTAYSQYGSRIFGYQIQHWNGGGWTVDVNGGTMGAFASDNFPTVVSSKVRLVLTNMTSAPSIYELYVYRDAGSISAPGAPVWINEWMLNNAHTLVDPANGLYEPWFELYNAGATNVNLSGYYLTSTPTNWFQFQIPSGYSLAPGGSLLVWADGLAGQNSGSDLHASFSLPPVPVIGLLNGATPGTAPAVGTNLLQSPVIGLVNSAGQVVDAVDLLAQAADVSSGSNPDGDPGVLSLRVPTPRRSNNQIWGLPPAISPAGGPLSLSFTGFPLATNRILAAGQLQSVTWTNLASVFADGLGSFNFADTNTHEPAARFYRAVSP